MDAIRDWLILNKQWLDIGSGSIAFLSAIFGIFFKATVKEDPVTKRTRLTGWGIFTLTTLLISSGIQGVLKYTDKAEQEMADKTKKEQLAKEDAIMRERFKVQLDKLETITNGLQGIDSGVRKQNIESNQRFSESLRNLNHISGSISDFYGSFESESHATTEKFNASLKKQNNLQAKQEEANNNINRTLNPLFPFAVAFKVNMVIDEKRKKGINTYKDKSYDPWIKLKKMIAQRDKAEETERHRLKNLLNFSGSGPDLSTTHGKYPGIYKVSSPSKEFKCSSCYLITPDYKYFSEFLWHSQKVTFSIYDTKSPTWGVKEKVMLSGSPQYKKKNKVDDSYEDGYALRQYGLYFYFCPDSNEVLACYYLEHLSLQKEDGVYKSVNDLEGNYFELRAFNSWPMRSSKVVGFDLYLPPFYSRQMQVKQIDSSFVKNGINISTDATVIYGN